MTQLVSGQEFDIVEASIDDIRNALDAGKTTAVEIAAHCLLRISRYDCQGISLNAVPILNPDIFAEAAACDDRRARGECRGLLDGVPFTVKDSYKVKGMTVASGSPAFQNLVSNEDAFMVKKLRDAGAVLVGKTNMPPMAAGGMQRGVYGRAENPYNLSFLAAAFASGSSNGSAVATAASFASFGLGGETVSSGRSPASNNGLVAYTPSRGLISIRGTWPLYPTCDVAVPHTRSVDDLLEILDTLTAHDDDARGDFWREQPFLKIPETLPSMSSTFKNLPRQKSLQGLRIGVPTCYIGGKQLDGTVPVYTSPEVIQLWKQAKSEIEELGAVVIEMDDFPVVRGYESGSRSGQQSDPPMLPVNWNTTERGVLIAHGWNDFLLDNADSNLPSLTSADQEQIFPQVPLDHPQIKYSEPANAILWSKLSRYLQVKAISEPDRKSLFSIPSLSEACHTLEKMRKVLFEDWLDANSLDCIVFPAAGDVAAADADVNDASAEFAWTNGVKYSNGNRAIRHLGVPTVTVPMRILPNKKVPVGLTFCGKAYTDDKLLTWSGTFERSRQRRIRPLSTPSLDLGVPSPSTRVKGSRPLIKTRVRSSHSHDTNTISIEITGSFQHAPDASPQCQPHIQIFLNSHRMGELEVEQKEQTSVYTFTCKQTIPAPRPRQEAERVHVRIPRDQTMAVVLAQSLDKVGGTRSRLSGWYGLY